VSQTRSSESVYGSFSPDSKTWNPQTSPHSVNFGKKLSSDCGMRKQPVRVSDQAAQVATRHKADNSPEKVIVEENVRLLGRQSDAASGIFHVTPTVLSDALK